MKDDYCKPSFNYEDFWKTSILKGFLYDLEYMKLY